jgi:hypothetical protein
MENSTCSPIHILQLFQIPLDIRQLFEYEDISAVQYSPEAGKSAKWGRLEG